MDSLLKLTFKRHLTNYWSGSEWSVNILPSCTPTLNTLSCYSNSCLTSVSTFWQIKSPTWHTKEPRLLSEPHSTAWTKRVHFRSLSMVICSIGLLCRPRFKCKDGLVCKDASTRFGSLNFVRVIVNLSSSVRTMYVFTKEPNLERRWLKTWPKHTI